MAFRKSLEQRLFDLLVERRGRVVSRREIFEKFWREQVGAAERDYKKGKITRSEAYKYVNEQLNATVGRLRKKLGEEGDRIRAIPSLGYRYADPSAGEPVFSFPFMLHGKIVAEGSPIFVDEIVAIKPTGRYAVLGYFPTNIDLEEDLIFRLVDSSPFGGIRGLLEWAEVDEVGASYSFDAHAGIGIREFGEDIGLVVTRSGSKLRLEYTSRRNLD